MKRIEILVDNDRAAEALLSLIQSFAVAEMLDKAGGIIVGALIVDAANVPSVEETQPVNVTEAYLKGEEE